MGKLFGEFLAARALYTLNGAGFIVIAFALISFYIVGNFGWIAEIIFCIIVFVLILLIMRLIINWINKNCDWYRNNKEG